ncbi:hypothetical protein [Fimbriiglobus ruber]|uniref:Uncharacterized protein n=1 Tax=Fimbriiglobus ruber TaxID=1908690 RepID=A0A225DVU5_9BACT|nr:hypothetical protein [Fimbriiglobus ruber]OWK40425.1 hypothetical protein FRUB_05344 [Fimbriiglobus ruber]
MRNERNGFDLDERKRELAAHLARGDGFLDKFDIYVNHFDFAGDAFQSADAEEDRHGIYLLLVHINREMKQFLNDNPIGS